MYIRICPVCNRERPIKTKWYFEKLEKENLPCLKCKPRKKNNKPRYNKPRYSKPRTPRKFSEQARKNISEAQKKKYAEDEEYRKKHALKNKGRIASEKTRIKLSECKKGIKNHFFGKKHSKESLEKISKSSSRFVKEKNPFFGKKHSEESRKKMSISRAKGLSEGSIIQNNGYGVKGWYFSNKNNQSFYYDSLLEKFRMIQLDNDLEVISWTKRHGIKIQYISSYGKSRNFVPDFLITYSLKKVLEEVKGKDKEEKSKFEALKNFCFIQNFDFKWTSQREIEHEYRKFLEEERKNK